MALPPRRTRCSCGKTGEKKTGEAGAQGMALRLAALWLGMGWGGSGSLALTNVEAARGLGSKDAIVRCYEDNKASLASSIQDTPQLQGLSLDVIAVGFLSPNKGTLSSVSSNGIKYIYRQMSMMQYCPQGGRN